MESNRGTGDWFYVRPNDVEECWEVMERAAVPGDGVLYPEDAVIARFYLNGREIPPIVNWLVGEMNARRALERR